MFKSMKRSTLYAEMRKAHIVAKTKYVSEKKEVASNV